MTQVPEGPGEFGINGLTINPLPLRPSMSISSDTNYAKNKF